MSSPRGKVLVAMSGGVDSSVAAAILQRDGWDVVGCFMRLGSPGETLDELMPDEGACATPKIKIGHQGCCSINDAADARQVAARLGIPFYVCNFKKDFGRIIDYFVDEYAQGRTPNPCVRCNDWLKFGKLHEYAQQIGASHVASGHYARIGVDGAGKPTLRRGLDETKDQSYVLFGAPRERLRDMLFPVGEMPKTRVRELAREFDLPVFDKPDSQEICFVPDNDYAGLVERKRADVARPGEIVDAEGNVVGEHGGQHQFTVGQRRGLSLALGYPVYVVSKDAQSNRVVVGPREMLLSGGCTALEANWLVDVERFAQWAPVFAKYRYNSAPVAARVKVGPDWPEETPSGRAGTFHVQFDEPQSAVAPGQAVVLLDAADPGLVLGGGWIATTRPVG
ncbi:MAG: tRNA 2-thiouridine(34) synthase MnmA [Planctomycetota bacterium]|nr:tRNA 2-thiouridine(34) synthase MnmA [Planctomycetota bacterium]